ncbi:MAG TPA: 4Fe-4S dicluster domain-containing protein [Spirochaetia bacterium]|nr:4Fe-4S dicluster domain-containing protein [Spirochaetales bacterium]HRS65666.1 4Fe-4S dicluster domain-containing protein [Spirochaetia bacterium]HOT58685.1 4Fe-4S dicluster domain-containing protein [Spirochaetales bacterium]HPD79923.1 4Fe-4S dicluster domain-containing protein [Spirochaetales bacterium]HQG39534.1 4Fe-4S dicluster domain-containing protein [Spirochaetales bacterium]
MKYTVPSFHGGIEIKKETNSTSAEIIQTYIPNYALLVLKTYENQPDFRIVVYEGQEIAEGQVVAQSNTGYKIHAPIPCVLHKIVQVVTPMGYISQALVIKLSGYFTLSLNSSERYHWRSLNSNDIRFLLNEKGVICSISGKPLTEELAQNSSADILVINTLIQDMNCHGENLLFENTKTKILEAAAILHKIFNFSSIIIATHFEYEFTNTEIKIIEELKIPINFRLFPLKYPQADNHLIEKTLLKTYPKNEAHKILTLETRTLIAVYDAVVKNKPFIEQYVFVGGNCLKTSALLKAKIGTPIGSLIEELGGFIMKPDIIAINNVLKGQKTLDLDTPVTKNMHAIIALNNTLWQHQSSSICTTCGTCIDVCPCLCNPMEMYKNQMYNIQFKNTRKYFEKCIACGLCTYVCPGYIKLQDLFLKAKRDLL